MGRWCTIAISVAMLGLVGCRMGEKELEPDHVAPADPTAETPATITASEIDSLELTYAGLRGRFRRAQGRNAVPVVSRRLVRVTWPTGRERTAGDDTVVHVVDLTRSSPDGSYTTELSSSFEFEARALAYLPPGASSRVTLSQYGLGRDEVLHEHASVRIYGTGWCGACKQARDFFRARGVRASFFDLDVDPRRVDELGRKADRLGIELDRVPVIDVRGRLLVGFDQTRLETLLGDRL